METLYPLQLTSKLLITLFVGLPIIFYGQYTGSGPYCHEQGGLIVNEFSNGPSGGVKEYIEMVVIGDPDDPAAPVDLSGWILDDNNYPQGGQGNAPGHLVFGDCYTAVPPGAIIVVYNAEDRNDLIPADDPFDNNPSDGVYIIPHTNDCMDACLSDPTISQPNYCPCRDLFDTPAGWFFNLRNAGDAVQIRDKCETLAQAFSWNGVLITDKILDSPVDIDLGEVPQSNRVVYFTNENNNNWNDASNYVNPTTPNNETPGAANTPANATFINSVSSGTFSCSGLIWDCKDTDAGDLILPMEATDPPIMLCEGEDLSAFFNDFGEPDEFEPDAVGFDFEYAFILTLNDAPTFTIIDFNLSGDFDFSGLSPNDYMIWGFSFIQTNGTVSVIEFLEDMPDSIEDILNYQGCGFDGNVDNLDIAGNEVLITISKIPLAVDPGNLEACGDDNGRAVFALSELDSIVNGNTNFQVIWSSDPNGDEVIANPAAFETTQQTVYALVDNGACLSNAVAIELNVRTDFNVISTINQEISCFGADDATIGLTISGGLPPYLIDWGGSIPDGTVLATDLGPGTYQVNISDANDCSTSTTIEVVEPSEITLVCTEQSPVTIAGNSDGVGAFNIAGGIAPYQLEWDNGTLNGSQEVTGAGVATLDNLSVGIYSINLTDSRGCMANCNLEITEPPCDLNLELQPSDISCFGEADGMIDVEVSGGLPPYSFNWSNGSDQMFLQSLIAGAYTLVVTDQAGCSVSETIEIMEPSSIDFTYEIFPPVCSGDLNGYIQLQEISGGTAPFDIFLDETLVQTVAVDNAVINGLAGGSYALVIQDQNGCAIEVDINMLLPDDLVVDLESEIMIQLGDSVALTPKINFIPDSILWTPSALLSDPNSQYPTTKPNETQVFQFTAWDENGCSVTEQVMIIVDRNRNVFIPTVFSPDANGINDSFTIFAGTDVVQIETFMVFDRWGNQVFARDEFQPNDERLGWDGTFRGQEMNSGVYVFMVNIEFQDGLKEQFKGNVTLLR